jgi:hypothetical protein
MDGSLRIVGREWGWGKVFGFLVSREFVFERFRNPIAFRGSVDDAIAER